MKKHWKKEFGQGELLLKNLNRLSGRVEKKIIVQFAAWNINFILWNHGWSYHTCTNSRGSLTAFKCFCTYDTLVLMNVKCFDTLAKITVVSGALNDWKWNKNDYIWLTFAIKWIYNLMRTWCNYLLLLWTGVG